jgi:hypothetical protein
VSVPIVIDGYSQPGSSPNTLMVGSDAVLKIVIDFGSVVRALDLTGGSATVSSLIRGLVFNNGAVTTEKYLDLRMWNITVEGCYFGTDANGMSLVGAPIACIESGDSSTIGGTTPAARNVIAGSIQVRNGDSVMGNFLGVRAQGDSAFTVLTSSPTSRVNIAGSGTLIGGSTPSHRNVIAPGRISAVNIGQGSNSVIQGNYLGVDATGSHDVGDGDQDNVGVWISSGPGQLITGNLISGFTMGINVRADSNSIQGNHLGTDALGNPTLGNVYGVYVQLAGGTVIGGSLPGEGNTIAGNIRGVEIHSTAINNAIQGNSIWSSTELGIDLNASGVTANDPDDVDLGANNLQNFPVLTEALDQPTQGMISGALNSAANTQFTIDYYYNGACDGSGHGEGEQYLGGAFVTTDGSGDVSFVFTSQQVGAGGYVTATATDPMGNTSEFSACRLVLLDTDGDSLADINDNCPFTANGLQEDGDANDIGDACQIDDTLFITLYSPVDMVVTDPYGDSIGLDSAGSATLFNTILNGSVYDTSGDFNNDTHKDDRVIIPVPAAGPYSIRIIKEPSASNSDKFTMAIRIDGNQQLVPDGYADAAVSALGAALPATYVWIASTIYTGDINADGNYSSSDIILLVNYVFKGGTPPDPAALGDFNCSGAVQSSDIIGLVNFIFKGGARPCSGSAG